MKKNYLFGKMMSLLMVVVMIFAMLPMTAFASTTDENGNVWYGDQLYVDVEEGSEGYTWMSLFRTYAHGYEFSGHFMGDGEGPQTFVMIDTVAHGGTTWTPNGTYHPMYSNYEVTYCCDVETMIVDSTYYKRVNLEDSEYYTNAQAAKIRAIVTNSYPYVSLADMKADLAANGYAYANELTCNDALAAIQVAIWCCANGMSAEDLRYAKSYKVSDNLQWGYPLHDTSAQSGLDVSGKRVFKTYEEVGIRIDSLVDYLLAQSSVYADKAQIIITKLEMDCGSVVAGEEKPEVTLNLELNNSGSGYQDNINIDIMVNGEVVKTFPVELGKEQYAIKINANREDNIKAVVYGTQVLPAGVYFYAPKPADVNGDGIATSREVSQNLVGVAMGATPVWAEAEILVPEKTKVHVTKVWDDAQNSDGKRPEEITVNLLADGEVIASQNLSDENGWAWTFEDLAVFDGERPIEYSVEEVSVDGYETTIVGSVADGFIITNRMYVHTLGSITVTKTSTGADTPATATFQLQKHDGENWINVGEAVPYSAFVDGKYTFSDLTEGSYRVIEDGAEIEEFHLVTVDGEIITLTKTTMENGDTSVSEADTTVTNDYTPYIHELGSITVTKVTDGAATPATATFQLQMLDGENWINVGEAVPYSAFVDGQYTFSDLTEGSYRVIEDGAEVEEFHLVTVDGEIVTLTKTTEENGDTFVSEADTTVTNEYTPYIHELGSITVTKISTGADTPATATFQLQMLDGENWINVGEAVPYSAFVDGKYTFFGLTEGSYRVIEDGAEIEEFHLVTVDGEIVTLTKTTEENGDTFVSEADTTVTNAYTPYIHELGSITVTKISAGADTPATATFQLQKQDGENWINVGEAVPYSAFVDGKYTISGLTEGAYRIIEDGAAIAEYRLATSSSGNVVLTKTTEDDGDTFVSSGSIEVTNVYTAYVHTLGSITVTKTSTGADTPATATFQLQKQDGENWINVGEAVPYSAFVDGKYTFSDLTEGTYRVIEDGAEIDGFILTTTNSGNVVLTKSYNYGDTSVNNGEISLVNEYEEEEEIIEIPEDDVPLADVPNTGDQILPFLSIAIVSGAAAIFVGKFGKKEEEEA